MPFRTAMRFSAVIALAAFAGLKAQAYDSIIVFGDSYNDVGNIYTIAAEHGIAYPPAPYYEGRFSNGPIWIEHIASDFGIPLTPSAAGGTDFAEGGAELLQAVTLEGLPIPSIQDQVQEYLAYLAAHRLKPDPNALYVIEGGGNDILDATDFSPKLGCDIANALFGLVKTLQQAGAKSFLVPDLLDVGQLPAAALGGASFIKFASDTSIEANRELDKRLDQEWGRQSGDWHRRGIEIVRIPVFGPFLAVANAKTHFGFTNVLTPCVVLSGLTVASECADPVHTLWWDAEHPSEFGHAFFAILAEGQLANH